MFFNFNYLYLDSNNQKYIIMKKTFLTFCLVLSSIMVIYSQTYCECGTHSTGITYYEVGSGQECCTGTPGTRANITYYEQNEGGTWKVVRVEEITAADAQRGCCSSSS